MPTLNNDNNHSEVDVEKEVKVSDENNGAMTENGVEGEVQVSTPHK
ncbi:hypothetical protein [Piscirickettsia salmonis]|nr:hypothetical protein [Piscirickettsia salmonis]QGN78194.1 hypothetical protein Psal001_02423 [Piscirickettsia salmonis]QGN81774.1 hypothetical protein Psal002_02438 [Piscirickettsia salmonis]QGN83953.1 hypothetical protein Psal003_00993 [Piscirickettsia salmonis]QGN87464.1 hypothetical protein Psal004_00990 [Piscirickettsia salmonis]QGN92406.1 hypothetical protein Psal005_02463 [Piscirickettsia salmonis]